MDTLYSVEYVNHNFIKVHSNIAVKKFQHLEIIRDGEKDKVLCYY